MPSDSGSSRRSLLSGLAGGLLSGLAGCNNLPGSSVASETTPEPPESPRGEKVGPTESSDELGSTEPPASDTGIATDQNLAFRETSERTLRLDYARPADDVVRPLVIHVHGGGWYQGEKGYAHAERLVRTGAAVASVEYRLSGEATFPAAVRDVVAAIKWLRATADAREIDPERIALVGESAGGHLATLVGSALRRSAFQPPGFHPDVPTGVEAVVSISGIYDLTAEEQCAASTTVDFLGGDCEDVPDAARNASPVSHADGGDPPVVLYHGTDDEVVPHRQAARYRDALEDAGVDVDLVSDDGGGHLLGESADDFLPRQVEFLARHLDIET